MTEQTFPEMDGTRLEALARAALNKPDARLDGPWSCHPLGGGVGGSLGVYRLAGNACVGETVWPWSVVLKISASAAGAAPDTWEYPPREAFVYRSDLLEGLPSSLIAPRCYAVEEGPDGTTRMWLEDVVDEHPGQWPPERHAIAAAHLGRFNSAYLTNVPQHPWLSHLALRDLVESAGPAVASLERLAGPDGHPIVRTFYSPSVVKAFCQLWDEREAFLNALSNLPQTLCHRDAHRRNLFSRIGPDGVEQMVLIDWACAIHGALGEDAAGLVMSNLLLFEAVGIAPRDLDAICFANYLNGFQEGGWSGDPRTVRLGYTAAASMQHMLGFGSRAAAGLSNSAAHPFFVQLFRRSLTEVVEAWNDVLWPFHLGLIEEARELMRTVG
jgi:hypothetical protein